MWLATARIKWYTLLYGLREKYGKTKLEPEIGKIEKKLYSTLILILTSNFSVLSI